MKYSVSSSNIIPEYTNIGSFIDCFIFFQDVKNEMCTVLFFTRSSRLPIYFLHNKMPTIYHSNKITFVEQ